jgi:hypothetical protein
MPLEIPDEARPAFEALFRALLAVRRRRRLAAEKESAANELTAPVNEHPVASIVAQTPIPLSNERAADGDD